MKQKEAAVPVTIARGGHGLEDIQGSNSAPREFVVGRDDDVVSCGSCCGKCSQ